MQYRRDALGLPVVKEAPHVLSGLFGALNENRLVTDILLLFGNGRDVLTHDLRADLHVTDRMVTVGFGITLPNLYAMRHELAHGRLVIVVAHNATGNA